MKIFNSPTDWLTDLYLFVLLSFFSHDSSIYHSTRAGHAHQSLNPLLLLVQSTALLEILHASLGLVRSSVMTTVMQVASRLLVVWYILPFFPQVRSQPFSLPLHIHPDLADKRSLLLSQSHPQTAHSPIYASMVLAWSLSEIIRYGTYVSSLLNYPIQSLLWLRYSAFYALYPLGAGSEWGLIFLASKWVFFKAFLIPEMHIPSLILMVLGSVLQDRHSIQRRRIKYFGHWFDGSISVVAARYVTLIDPY